MSGLSTPRRARIAGDHGFTIVEVMVGAMILLIGALSLLGVLQSSSKASTSTSRLEVAVNQAEKQLEWARTLAYNNVYMTSIPTAGTDDSDPRFRIQGSGASAKFKVGGSSSKLEDVVSSGSGAGISPGPVAFTVGSGSQAISGKLYTFVSWRDEECPLLKLGSVSSTLNGLQTVLSARASATQALLTSLNNILVKTTPINNLIAQLSGASGLVAKLNSATTAVGNMLANSSYTQALSQGLDLCDLPNTLDFSSVDPLTKTFSSGQSNSIYDGLVANLTTSVLGHDNAVSGVLGQLSGLSCVLLPAVCTTVNGFTSDAPTLKGTADTVSNGLTALGTWLSSPNTTHNTKRISVAITIDNTRTDVAPSKPIWISTVVSDPTDGLL